MGTENNLQPVRYFKPQYAGILAAVFNAQAAFSKAFAPIQKTDGITSNTKAFTVKTNATPVVIGTYNKGANVGFGTGTGNSSRFGNRTEVIYADTDVDYSYELAIHEGVDISTVNADFNQAIADRLDLNSQAQVRDMNMRNGKFLSDNASLTLTVLGTTDPDDDTVITYTDAEIKKMFNRASKQFKSKEVNANKTAYLTSDLYNAMLDMAQTNSLKGASINLDTGTLNNYKGFALEETAEQYFAKGDIAYFSADNIVVPFVGIATARTIDSEDFDGKALQAHAKGGQFMLDDNKKALIKAVFSEKPVDGGGATESFSAPVKEADVQNNTDKLEVEENDTQTTKPTMASNKADIQTYLESKGIEYAPEATKEELMALVV